jgi:RNA polymerase sigma-70 factor (ECF subfamily)
VTDEQALLRRARRLDEAALATIFDTYYAAIYRYAYYHTGHAQTGEDLAARVFQRLLAHLHEGRGPDRQIKAWLYRVARNLIVDEARRGQHRDHLPLDETLADDGDAPEELALHTMQTEAVHVALLTLPDDQRDVIVLRFLAELDVAEVAAVLDVTPGALKARQHRALKALRRALARPVTETALVEETE